MVWSNGAALMLALAMIVGLLGLVFYQGMSTFWPRPAIQVTTSAGKKYLGEIVREDRFKPEASAFDALPTDARAAAKSTVDSQKGFSERRLLRTDNFELSGSHHNWVADFEIADETRPEWALVF